MDYDMENHHCGTCGKYVAPEKGFYGAAERNEVVAEVDLGGYDLDKSMAKSSVINELADDLDNHLHTL